MEADVYTFDALRKRVPRHLKSPKILLVDDDPVFGRIMILFAERAGLDITYCGSLASLQRVYLPSFDIGIFDYDLQNISGIQAIQALEARGAKLPTLLVSSYARPVFPAWASPGLQFAPKSLGPIGILSRTLGIYEKAVSNRLQGDVS